MESTQDKIQRNIEELKAYCVSCIACRVYEQSDAVYIDEICSKKQYAYFAMEQGWKYATNPKTNKEGPVCKSCAIHYQENPGTFIVYD